MISVVLWSTLYLIVIKTDMTSCHVFEPCTSNKTPNNCGKQNCGSINYDEIEKLYRGFFFAENEIIERSKVKASRRHNRLNNWTSLRRKKHAHQSETSGIQKKTQSSKLSRLEMYKLIMTSKSKSVDKEMESKMNCEPEAAYPESLPGDGDACCATEVNYIANETLENINGTLKTIVHLTNNEPSKYQLIPHGKCIGYGRCKGDCYQEVIYLTLLVYDMDSKMQPPVSFDTFELPGYCSCKNTT